jgi:amino-acid N-acetyltransferase
MKNLSIKPASSKDAESIKGLLQACHLPFEDITAGHLEHFYVIEGEKGLEGNIGIEICGAYGLLRSLAVTESMRGQGLGEALTQHIEDYARDKDLKALYLLTTTAANFFSHLGYEPTERVNAPDPLQETNEFKSICPASAVCMVKLL